MKSKYNIKETLINSANEMKYKAHGTQQTRHINLIGEGASAAQRSDSLVQSINQHFLSTLGILINPVRKMIDNSFGQLAKELS